MEVVGGVADGFSGVAQAEKGGHVTLSTACSARINDFMQRGQSYLSPFFLSYENQRVMMTFCSV